MSKMTEKADRLAKLKEDKAQLENDLKRVNGDIETTSGELVEIMNLDNIQNFSHDGKMFYKSVTSFPKILDEDAFFAFLEAKAEDGIIRRTIHPSTLRSWYKEQGLKYDPELFKGKLEVFEKLTVRVRKGE